VRAFVTGATGFLGSHVAEQLAARGDAVRALARPGSARSHLDSLHVEIVAGDLRTPADWMPSLEGIDVVFHCAAVVGDWGRWPDFEAVSVGGTRAIVEAAARGGVKRFVHLSSTAVYGLRQVRGRRVDEDAPLRGDSLRWGYYGRAKVAAERIVREAHDRGRIECTLLRPAIVYGPRDRTVLPRLAYLLRAGRLRIAGNGENRVHLLYAADLADAALRAAEAPTATGRAYNLDGDERVTQRGFLEAVAAITGAPLPTRSAPLALLYCLGLLHEIAGHLRKRAQVPDLTRYLVALTGGETHYETARAARDLGWRPATPLREGMAHTRAWVNACAAEVGA